MINPHYIARELVEVWTPQREQDLQEWTFDNKSVVIIPPDTEVIVTIRVRHKKRPLARPVLVDMEGILV